MMENIKKITGAEFVRILTGGKFLKLGYMSKKNTKWDRYGQQYISDPLDIDGVFKCVSEKLDAISQFIKLYDKQWVTARARSKDIVHSDEVYEDMKNGTFYLMEHAGNRVLIHDYTDGANISVKLLNN
jgi:hypothetical protein